MGTDTNQSSVKRTAKSTTVNIATHLRQMAEKNPYQRAVVYPVSRDHVGNVCYSHLTFTQLDHASDMLAHGLTRIGISRGVRTILMVKPSMEFFALTFALFKVGAAPVVVDPGMGIKRMVTCLQQSRPEAFIGISKAHLLRFLYPRHFKTVQRCVTIGRRWFWTGATLRTIWMRPWEPFEIAATAADETAAVVFTTGSTGPAKGVVYTHGAFDSQVRCIRDHFNIQPGEIDLPTFPLFALFDPAMGMTAIIPDMDPTRPAEVEQDKILEAVINQGVTNMFASPALLNRVGAFGKDIGIKLPSLKRVVSAGAPVSPANIEQFSAMLKPETQIYTPYGASEAMPVTSIGSQEILSQTAPLTEQGYGMCVGRAVAGMTIEIITITDDPIEKWREDLPAPDGEIGEITVQAKWVTRQYFDRPEADASAKIADGDTFWHRMGDLGWRDSKGRIWFCGRKSHRVQTAAGDLFTIPCESLFNNHALVYRSALVGLGRPGAQHPVICIETLEPVKGKTRRLLQRELLELAKSHPLTEPIDHVLFHPAFPVDIRHNSKIFREQLAVWAQKKIGPLPDDDEPA